MSHKMYNHITTAINGIVEELLKELNNLNEENQNLRDIIADLNTELAVCQATIDMLRGDEEP